MVQNKRKVIVLAVELDETGKGLINRKEVEEQENLQENGRDRWILMDSFSSYYHSRKTYYILPQKYKKYNLRQDIIVLSIIFAWQSYKIFHH